jgi:NADPH:quinone reductase-like Zn-dependent oxidoreductase
MKEVIVHPTPDVWGEIHEVPIPKPQKDEVVIKVIVAGSNVKGPLSPFFPSPVYSLANTR